MTSPTNTLTPVKTKAWPGTSNAPIRVAVIDSAAHIPEVVGLCLELCWPGTIVFPATDGASGLELVQRERPDLVILDVSLPDKSGYALCQEIRQNSTVPVIMLSVRNQDVDIARGLEAGADDYISKPFSHLELLARVQAVLRRARGFSASTPQESPFHSKDVIVDFSSRDVRVRGESIKLTPIEFSILRVLVKNAGHVVSQRKLVQDVWGPSSAEAARHLRVHVQHLRQKLGDDPARPKLIGTEWRVGYRFLQAPIQAMDERSALN